MFFWTAGSTVAGCSTFAPKYASSAASSKLMTLMRRASGAEARIGGHHAVDVGPDFDAFGVEAGAKNRGGKIGAAAADGRGDAGAVRADESAHHGNFAGIEQRFTLSCADARWSPRTAERRA